MEPDRKKVGHKVLSKEKGRRGEAAVESHIEKKLIPKLKENEGWDIVVYCPIDSFENGGLGSEIRNEAWVFLANMVVPTRKLLDDFRTLVRILEHTPDGYLLKLRKTGEFKSLRDSLGMFNLRLPIPNYRALIRKGDVTLLRLHDKEDLNKQLAIVDGNIEFVEVKTDSGWFRPNQVEVYTDALSKGFHLRFFSVQFISYEENEYEIVEKLVTSPH